MNRPSAAPGTLTAPGYSANATRMACLLVVFLVLFPKGGIRLAWLPITWGYLLLMILFPTTLVVRLLAMPLTAPRRVWAAMLMFLPVQALFFFASACYGLGAIDFTFSTLVGLVALPWLFLVIFGPFYPMVDEKVLRKCFRLCVFAAAAWGIFLFVLHPLTGHFIEIPYLTVNASDFGKLESSKSIARGFFYKLISTYNNGNIYGVATLIIFPMYSRIEPSRFRRMLLRIALLLTLSRTVWVGLILTEVLSLVPPLFAQIRTFPVLYLGEARKRFVAVLVTLGLVFASVFLVTLHGGFNFLFDPTLAGRSGEISGATGSTFLPEMPFVGFQEVLYASAATEGGIVGFLAFTLLMVSPLFVLLGTPEVMQHPVRRAALKGLLIYSVMAASDGAFNFIPVMAFYWFAYAVFLYGWPGTQARTLKTTSNPAPRPLGLGGVDGLLQA